MESDKKKKKGLHVPSEERDSCGVGLIAKLTGEASHGIVEDALTMLENMEHRGACGCEENTGDGAGLLVQIPHKFFQKELAKAELSLPALGKYGVAMVFLPKEKIDADYCKRIIDKYAKEFDFEIFYERNVPVENSMIGKTALDSEPDMMQLFFKTTGFNYKDIEKRFYLLRSSVLKKIYFAKEDLRNDFYIASLSSKTIVYKGLLRANQLRKYFIDLQDESFCSAVAILHSRFSTNTLPKWKLAQPFRCIAHNGEINTIQGNINWWNAREKHMEKVSKIHPELIKVFPICDPFLSDSGNLDNVVDFLLRASRSIPHSIMMMIPEAWQNDPLMPEYKKSFYEYHDAVMEPWDGPASICFTDGVVLGATLDRNGLRPSRYVVTSDDLLVLGSEFGTLNIDESKIVKKGRLEAGKMLVADLEEKRIISDEELKETICKRKPYKKWLTKSANHIDDLKTAKAEDAETFSLKAMQFAAGMTKEDEDLILRAMLENKKEAIGSMGADIPLAVLSKTAQHISHYFKQQFAQVTNPPIDSLREQFYMSLSTIIGGSSKIIGIGYAEAELIRFDRPILSKTQFESLVALDDINFQTAKISITHDHKETLEAAISRICTEAYQTIIEGKKIICLSDRAISKELKGIPSLMIVGALHHFLIEKGLRKEVSILADVSDVWEAHHVACLLSYGVDLIHPYLAFASIKDLAVKLETPYKTLFENYIKAMDKALLKIMSKLGVSTLASYKGAQTFEALGIATEVIDVCFKGTISRIEGMRFSDLEKEQQVKHEAAFNQERASLIDVGNYQWKRNGEYHLFNPTTIHLLQHSTKTKDYKVYKKFANAIDKLEFNNSTLRSYLKIKPAESIPLSEVEDSKSILKRFATGAMSFGSISEEAHTTLAIAMNRIGGKSNSGEGGEDELRFVKKENDDWERSAIKQVASGRFGVNINYLTNADELQIKIAQGAKPGEGGQLPGHKVDENIARIRNSTPGVGLISPPPHHDIYSIEDLAQLIFDLKNANKEARISVKLVSKAGVGVIASGVTKAHADHILISGFDGGTGASPLSSVRHAGIPWEIGLSETHQTLVKNGLRDRVVLQADGQIRTGRDLAIASMLGAEEWGIATAALVVEGCIMMRKCHLNTCPVGIATQDKSLREKFDGKVEHLINYFNFLANHLREIMASIGVRTVDELVGRTDLLEINNKDRHWKSQNLDLNPILFKEENIWNTTLYASKTQNHGLENILDKKLIFLSQHALNNGKRYSTVSPIINTDRATGTMLSNEIAKRYGSKGMNPASINVTFVGSAGQSFGAFASRGLSFTLEGDANDYFGKGLSGAILIVKPKASVKIIPEENVIIGNVALYGATAGEAYINGIAGDRFAVRNSGANVVVEGAGDNACEYMTGGKAIFLGKVGRNFGAGMSGGLAFILRKHYDSKQINPAMVLIEDASEEDLLFVKKMIRNYANYTGSKKALDLLNNWDNEASFVKIIPEEYKLALASRGNQFVNQTKAS